MKPDETFAEVVEELDRIEPRCGQILERISSARDGKPQAQRFDGTRTSGHTTIKFCEAHGEENCPCGEATTYPAVSDPTGEMAIRLAQRKDVARRDLGRYYEAIRLVRKGRTMLYDLDAAYMPHHPTLFDRAETEGDNEPGCVSCARLPAPSGVKGAKRWEPPTTKKPSKKSGLLLCWFCDRWWGRTGAIPPTDVLEDHHAGKRVTWPGEEKRPA